MHACLQDSEQPSRQGSPVQCHEDRDRSCSPVSTSPLDAAASPAVLASPATPPRAPASPAVDLRSSSVKNPLFASDAFRINCFKILLCNKRLPHEWRGCPYAHVGEIARRRPLDMGYSSEMCPNTRRGLVCPTGDACPFAHSVFEAWLHPDKYKTMMCVDGPACDRKVCFFAHTSTELRTPSGGADNGDDAPFPTAPYSPADAAGRPSAAAMMMLASPGSAGALMSPDALAAAAAAAWSPGSGGGGAGASVSQPPQVCSDPLPPFGGAGAPDFNDYAGYLGAALQSDRRTTCAATANLLSFNSLSSGDSGGSDVSGFMMMRHQLPLGRSISAVTGPGGGGSGGPAPPPLRPQRAETASAADLLQSLLLEAQAGRSAADTANAAALRADAAASEAAQRVVALASEINASGMLTPEMLAAAVAGCGLEGGGGGRGGAGGFVGGYCAPPPASAPLAEMVPASSFNSNNRLQFDPQALDASIRPPQQQQAYSTAQLLMQTFQQCNARGGSQ